jgi:hypothetical protein
MWEWLPATIQRVIAITPLKSSGMQAKTAPTTQKQPDTELQSFFFD